MVTGVIATTDRELAYPWMRLPDPPVDWAATFPEEAEEEEE